jgi:hypothetical protein
MDLIKKIIKLNVEGVLKSLKKYNKNFFIKKSFKTIFQNKDEQRGSTDLNRSCCGMNCRSCRRLQYDKRRY